MSWSLSIGPTKKENLREAINATSITDYIANSGPMLDQLHAAFDAAELLAKSVPGPYIILGLSGHANGVGWQKKEGTANDTIDVRVTQVTEEDLHYYKQT